MAISKMLVKSNYILRIYISFIVIISYFEKMFNHCIYDGNKYVITMYITQEKYAYLEDLCHVAPIEMDFTVK